MNKVIHQDIQEQAGKVKELLKSGKTAEATNLWTAFVTSRVFTADKDLNKDISVMSILRSCNFKRNMVSILGDTIYVNGISLNAAKYSIGLGNVNFIVTDNDLKSNIIFNLKLKNSYHRRHYSQRE
eukprot:UN27230